MAGSQSRPGQPGSYVQGLAPGQTRQKAQTAGTKHGAHLKLAGGDTHDLVFAIALGKGLQKTGNAHITQHISASAAFFSFMAFALPLTFFLYPALQKDPAAHIQQLAAKFSREMGTLADVYKAYRDRFMLTSQIEADPALFLKETARVLQALSNRLQKEDKELYPLLKK